MATVRMDSPLGVIEILASAAGVTRVDFVDAGDAKDCPPESADEAARERTSETARVDAMAHARQAERELREYFEGARRTFTVALDVRGTAFQERCWAFLSTIPFGQTRSYLDEAMSLGDAKGTRAVGGANGKNPVPIIVPCHRVIARSGALQGFAAGLRRKRWLLDHEMKVVGLVLVG